LAPQKKIRLGLLFGGRSPEHEISITNSASIAKEAVPTRIEIVPIYISREGRWLQYREKSLRLAGRIAGEEESRRTGARFS
jgi:D-alanine-D-alanine ligase